MILQSYDFVELYRRTGCRPRTNLFIQPEHQPSASVALARVGGKPRRFGVDELAVTVRGADLGPFGSIKDFHRESDESIGSVLDQDERIDGIVAGRDVGRF